MLRLAAVLALLVLTTIATSAVADDTDGRSEALRLAGEAMDLFQAGDYAAALDKFQKADELVPAPTLKLRVARCLDKLDLLQDAAEKYREVIAVELTRTAPAQHHEARKQAVPELASLLEQIPSVTVTVSGPGSTEAMVSVSGIPLSTEALGQKKTMDPGRYVVEVSAGTRRVAKDVTLRRGDHAKVVLELPPLGEDGSVSGPVSPEGDGAGLRAAGWAVIAVGGAALSVGSILGVVVVTEEDDLLARCVDRRCPPEAHGDARAFDAKRRATTAMLVIGGVGVAAGVTMLLLAPAAGDKKPEGLSLSPVVMPGGAGLQGRF